MYENMYKIDLIYFKFICGYNVLSLHAFNLKVNFDKIFFRAQHFKGKIHHSKIRTSTTIIIYEIIRKT